MARMSSVDRLKRKRKKQERRKRTYAMTRYLQTAKISDRFMLHFTT